MRQWSGLGYYSRARNLHRAARIIAESYGGEFPRALAAIAELPGIGRSTAAAIAAFAFGTPAAILDGNVKRVLSRVFAIEGDPAKAAYQHTLWSLAESLIPSANIEAYTQGLMDLGATVCVRRGAKCTHCPLVGDCVAYRSDRIDELPAARKRTALPQRDIAMLLLYHKGEVLLQKRPPVGIWGALWSLPELAAEHDPRALCRDRFGILAAKITKLPTLAHGFTHFSLRIHPLRVDVHSMNPSVREPGYMWVALADALGAVFPVPVRCILQTL
jgi:A/G-specific adenine glycosylase